MLVGVVLSLLAGCSFSQYPVRKEEILIQPVQLELQDRDVEKTLYPLGHEPLNISFYGHYSYYTMPQWGTDPSSKWIQDNLNIHISGISADGNAKLTLRKMIASKKLPDIVWGERDLDLEQMREEDLLVPLDAYIEKYPNLKHWAGEKVLNLLRASNGRIYYFPNYYSNRAYGNAGYVLNKKIYRELGSPKLETTDDLYQYLIKVKERYPDVVPFETGQAKEGHGIDQLFSAFKEDNLGFTRLYAVAEGGKMTSIYLDKGFRESALFVAKLMREGLMPSGAMIQTGDQVTEKLMKGKVAIYASANPMLDAMRADAELRKLNSDNGYMFIDPIYKQGLDRSKIYPGTYNNLGWNVTAITKSAKNPEAIFAMLDWMTGPEGSAVQMWGPPGPEGYWNGFMEDGITPNFTTRYGSDMDELTEIQAVSNQMIWVGNTLYLDQTKSNYERMLPKEQRNWATYWQQNVTWKSQGDATPFINVRPASNSEEGHIMRNLEEIWLDAREGALFGQNDEEVLSILDQAHHASMEVGFQKYLEYITKRWHDNIRVLNNE
ncbi:ABC transporter substrate-binding protein [Paenibacillus antarcticus]|uniref:ABC transporter substrate-binding protein n=2 Tax=Paenibacillus antarcticus TaxID=253703 RepID=A0A168JYV6_9BACL|nr:ABC transporter substrate-binding protein [Paenibacillus antarcticus]